MTRCRARTRTNERDGQSGKQCSRNALPDSFFCRQHELQGMLGEIRNPNYTPAEIMTISPDFSTGDIAQITARQGKCRTAEICLESGIGWVPSMGGHWAQGSTLKPYIEYFRQNGQESMAKDLADNYYLLSWDFSSSHPEVKQGFAPMPEINVKWQQFLRDFVASCEPYMEQPEGYESAIAQVSQREEMRNYENQIVRLVTNSSQIDREIHPAQMNWYRSSAEKLGRNLEEDMAAAQAYAEMRSARTQEFKELQNEWRTGLRQTVDAASQEYEENNPRPSMPLAPAFILE